MKNRQPDKQADPPQSRAAENARSQERGRKIMAIQAWHMPTGIDGNKRQKRHRIGNRQQKSCHISAYQSIDIVDAFLCYRLGPINPIAKIAKKNAADEPKPVLLIG